jgi:hypothetical protein
MLPRPYYDHLGDGDILPMTERAAKEIPKRITFAATLGDDKHSIRRQNANSLKSLPKNND